MTCSAGSGAQKGILKRSKVLEVLKEKLSDLASPHKNDAVAERLKDDGAAVAGEDPVSALDAVDDAVVEPSPSKKQ